MDKHLEYWKKNIAIITKLLIVWFIVAFVLGVIFSAELDSINFFGVPLGFWIASQGSIYVFLILIYAYTKAMNKLDEEHDVEE